MIHFIFFVNVVVSSGQTYHWCCKRQRFICDLYTSFVYIAYCRLFISSFVICPHYCSQYNLYCPITNCSTTALSKCLFMVQWCAFVCPHLSFSSFCDGKLAATFGQSQIPLNSHPIIKLYYFEQSVIIKCVEETVGGEYVNKHKQ